MILVNLIAFNISDLIIQRYPDNKAPGEHISMYRKVSPGAQVPVSRIGLFTHQLINFFSQFLTTEVKSDHMH